MSPKPPLLQCWGLILSLLGWLGGLVCCSLPWWKEILFRGSGLLLRHRSVEGLWITCSLPGKGKANCRLHSVPDADLPLDVRASRALTLACLVSGLLGLVLQILGSRWCSCVSGNGTKRRLAAGGSCLCALAGLALLLAVSWPAFILATEFDHPMITESLDVSLGACIYLGWAAGGALLLGGGAVLVG
ncbi:claudin-9-like, partial [Leucoraja erinacea]|uniref:claudin-9-like n=1 Tax=Leucoraja erinaceus TaxID=7782 RepID=UPI002455835C